MERIDGPLKGLLSRLRLMEPMMGWRAVEMWSEAVGHRVAEHCKAVAFHEGTLVVEVDSHAWMNELAYLKRRIIGDLNHRLDHEVVKEIKLRPAEGKARRDAKEN